MLIIFRCPRGQETEAKTTSDFGAPFLVPIPPRRTFAIPLLSLAHFRVNFPLPDLCGVPLRISRFPSTPCFEAVEDDDFEDFVPAESEHDEEDEFGEEEREGEATLDSWASRLVDEFIVPDADPVADEEPDYWPRRRHYNERVNRVEGVFEDFTLPRPRGLFALLARRDDVPKATVRFWFGHWVADREWLPYRRVVRRGRRLFSPELEERFRTNNSQRRPRQSKRASDLEGVGDI
jgi:hypothetical protein